MSELLGRVLREGYAWYMRDDGITPDTPLTDALVALYEATADKHSEITSRTDKQLAWLLAVGAARDRVTELMGEESR